MGAPPSALCAVVFPQCRALRLRRTALWDNRRTAAFLDKQMLEPRSINGLREIPRASFRHQRLGEARQFRSRFGNGSSTANSRAMTRSALASIAATRSP
jgi:hypothetical protein